jgi:ElaB/YqjD/DUF883 family membrane-anchored ribosome-binding protein
MRNDNTLTIDEALKRRRKREARIRRRLDRHQRARRRYMRRMAEIDADPAKAAATRECNIALAIAIAIGIPLGILLALLGI